MPQYVLADADAAVLPDVRSFVAGVFDLVAWEAVAAVSFHEVHCLASS